MRILFSENYVILALAVLSQYICVADDRRQTDRRYIVTIAKRSTKNQVQKTNKTQTTS